MFDLWPVTSLGRDSGRSTCCRNVLRDKDDGLNCCPFGFQLLSLPRVFRERTFLFVRSYLTFSFVFVSSFWGFLWVVSF